MWKHAHLSASLSEWSLPRSFLWLSVASRKKKGSAENATLVCSEVTSSKFHNFCQAELPAGFQWEGALVYCTCRDLGRTEVNLRIRPCNFFILQYPPGNLFASRHIPQNISPASPAVASEAKKNPQHCTRSPTQQCCFAPQATWFCYGMCHPNSDSNLWAANPAARRKQVDSRWSPRTCRGFLHSNSRVGHPKKVKVISGWGTQTGMENKYTWNLELASRMFAVCFAGGIWDCLGSLNLHFRSLEPPENQTKGGEMFHWNIIQPSAPSTQDQ